MFKEIFLFELKQWLKRPAIYIYFVIFLAISLLIGAAISGLFTGVTTDTNSHINSASAIAGILTSFSSDYLLGLITILACVALMAGCVQKDFQYNCFSFYFTKPISKFNYLIGRFSASFLLSMFVMMALLIGLWLSLLFAPNNNNQLGEFKFANFFIPFVLFTLLNTFTIGALFFSLVTWTRNMTSGYVGSLIFLVIAGVARTITSDIDNKTLAAIIDPFGQQALDITTEYWTPAESNTRMIPFSGYILYNRLFWFALSCGLIAITYFKFNFNQFLNPVKLFGRKNNERTSQPSKLVQSIGHLPKVTQVFNNAFAWKQILFLTKFEFKKITRSVFFYIMAALATLLTVLISAFSGLIYGTETWPVTYTQLDLLGGIFTFFLMVMVIFYSGVTIWRERDCKVDELIGASPIKNVIIFSSKYFAIMGLGIIMYLICIVTCIILQTTKGYYNFEIDLYIKSLLGMRIFSLMIVVALSLCMQVFFRNRYFGFFGMVLIMLGIPAILNAFDIALDLLKFNSSGSQMPYSDMNGFGHTVGTFFLYKFYWLGFVIVISTIAIAMYKRGKESTIKLRWKQVFKQFNLNYKLVLLVGAFLFVGCGSVIYYNIRVINPYKSKKEFEKIQVEFEEKYKKYQNEPQPRIVESNVHVDLFPDELKCNMKGFYYLKNKHKVAIKKIFININNEALIKKFEFNASTKKIINDTSNGFYSFELSKDLAPGDSIKFDYEIYYEPKNFIMKKQQTEIVYNGTFINNSLLPSIGYDSNSEIDDNTTRKKYNLKPKQRMAAINDSTAYGNTYISHDADWIRFECVVSTKEGQTAIAPGYLQKDWKKDNRHYFQYKMDSPILNFYSFLSANYEIKKDKWINPIDKTNEVNIEIYYQKGHEYNVDKMIKGIKKSLDYYTKNFSPYQHKQVRILEFPRYSTFAQSFPNTIPFSEGIGFIAKLNNENIEEVDYTFYVTAHEVAHQWWAHQVIGANVQGSTLMSETMSQYSALMVMEKEYGQAAMRKFLKYEMNSYLQGRAMESRKEVPLMLCENQQYIHYNKGSVIMYALKDYLGEDTLNAALQRYIKKVAFQEPPFTTANDFYSFIKTATPDSLKETVKDLFERIVVFNNKVKKWSYSKTPDGKFKIIASVNCIKMLNDSVGRINEIKPNDWIDIGVFAKNEKNQKAYGEIIYLKKIKIKENEQKIEVLVDKEPYMFGIDPLNKLIDKDTGDNSMDKNGKVIGGGIGEMSGVVVKAE